LRVLSFTNKSVDALKDSMVYLTNISKIISVKVLSRSLAKFSHTCRHCPSENPNPKVETSTTFSFKPVGIHGVNITIRCYFCLVDKWISIIFKK